MSYTIEHRDLSVDAREVFWELKLLSKYLIENNELGEQAENRLQSDGAKTQGGSWPQAWEATLCPRGQGARRDSQRQTWRKAHWVIPMSKGEWPSLLPGNFDLGSAESGGVWPPYWGVQLWPHLSLPI